MAADPRLFELLAQALGKPSKTYQAAQEGLSIPGSAMEGYKTGAEFMDSIRKRKFVTSPAGEYFQDNSLPYNFKPDTSVEDFAALAPFIKQNKIVSPWSVVPGMTTDEKNPIQQNRITGEVRPVDLTVSPTTHAIPGFPDIEWETSSPSNQALGKAVYEGRIRPSDMGTRDRGMAVKLANEYARISGLSPLKSYAGEVSGKTAAAFAVGKPGMNALSLNTAIGHANDAMDAYSAMSNMDTRLLNTPINALRAQSNDPNIIKLQATTNALSGELATVFKGSSGTDQEIGHWMKVFSQDLTPDQAKGLIPQVLSLLKSRQSALEYQRTSGMSGRGEMPLLSPKAEALTESLGNGSPAMSGTGDPEADAAIQAISAAPISDNEKQARIAGVRAASSRK